MRLQLLLSIDTTRRKSSTVKSSEEGNDEKGKDAQSKGLHILNAKEFEKEVEQSIVEGIEKEPVVFALVIESPWLRLWTFCRMWS